MASRLTAAEKVIYPESDGKPMAETDVHRDWMFLLIEMLKHFFKGRRVYVSGNLLIYYVKGNPYLSFSPDVFVVKGLKQKQRRIYKIWETGKAPNLALETTSKKTRREDKGKKKELYARLGIAEYFLYDPLGEWLKPALIGYRLVDGEYVLIEANPNGGIPSKQLGITFRLEGRQLVLYNTATGERLKTGVERATVAEIQALQAEAQTRELEARALQAEAQLLQVEALARQAQARADQEAAAREALEEELARLRAEQKPRERSRKDNGGQQ